MTQPGATAATAHPAGRCSFPHTDTHQSGLRKTARSDDIVREFRDRGWGDLSAMTMRLAVEVASRTVGLSDSGDHGLGRRIDSLLSLDPTHDRSLLHCTTASLLSGLRALRFYLLDVRLAIRARRRTPREDVISHLLGQGYEPLEILIECMPYAVAGHLYRRAAKDIAIDSDGETHTIPSGVLDLHIRPANADAAAVGERPLEPLAARDLPRGVQTAVLSFGDGAHRCPGAFVAIQETDVLLHRLLRLPPRIRTAPRLLFNDMLNGVTWTVTVFSPGRTQGGA